MLGVCSPPYGLAGHWLYLVQSFWWRPGDTEVIESLRGMFCERVREKCSRHPPPSFRYVIKGFGGRQETTSNNCWIQPRLTVSSLEQTFPAAPGNQGALLMFMAEAAF